MLLPSGCSESYPSFHLLQAQCMVCRPRMSLAASVPGQTCESSAPSLCQLFDLESDLESLVWEEERAWPCSQLWGINGQGFICLFTYVFIFKTVSHSVALATTSLALTESLLPPFPCSGGIEGVCHQFPQDPILVCSPNGYFSW